VYVHLPGGKGSYADVHAADGRSDLAVLKLLTPPDGLKAVKFGDVRLPRLPDPPPTVFPGKIVAVLTFQPTGGFAPDRPGRTVTSVVDVKFPANRLTSSPPQSVYRYAPLLELEGRAGPPVSGAAVLNLDGELVGLTSAVAAVAGGDDGRAYALPADANFRRIAAALARGEEVEYGFLGIVIGEAGPGGVGVREVSPRSPAADAGLTPGDVIVRIDGQPTQSYADLLYQIGSTLAGNRATLAVRHRGDPERTVGVTVAKFRHDGTVIAANRPAPVFGLRVDWGSVLAHATGGVQAVPPGVAVRELVPDSPAAARFKALGDTARWVVTHLNGAPTPTPAAFYQAARNQATVRLTVLDAGDRGGRPREVPLP
jgi:serine protease Do